MNARQPFDDLPREPLDADEAALARIHRALPASEPAVALDARILAQARAAVVKPARRPRPWFMGAGFGAAATAVMAAGIAWQLGWIGSIPGSVTTTPTELPRADSGAGRVQERAKSEAGERVEVEFLERESAADAVAPAPAPTALPPPEAPAAARKQRAAPPAAPPPPPAPVAEIAPVLQDMAPVPQTAAAPEPFPAESSEAGASPGAMARESDERKRDLERQENTQLDAITVTGSRIGKSRSGLPPWTEDAQLDADAWLERIRERVEAGDRQGAEHSLRRFVFDHPQRRVPRELQRLLVE
jgi:hypothetical protein